MSHIDKALAAWGDALPDWVRALAEEADRTSQNVVARLVGYSASAISATIGGTYAAKDTKPLEQAVRAKLMRAAVACPECGGMPLDQCLVWRKRAAGDFVPLGSLHRMMRRACQSCPHNGGASDVE